IYLNIQLFLFSLSLTFVHTVIRFLFTKNNTMQYDVLVIGSGPEGYVAAIRCAQLGMKTAVVERYPTYGGTCLNVGCIPSKALLDSSEHYHNLEKNFKAHGIEATGVKLDFATMVARKDAVVKQTTEGIAFLFKKNKIDAFQGHGSFVDKNTIRIQGEDGKDTTIETKRVIIATGSKPSSLPFLKIDKKRIITSTEALSLKEVPKNLILIGGGIIGLELGSVYARLGSNVTVVEYLDSIIPTMDRQLGRELLKTLKKLGINFLLGHRVTGATVKGKTVTLAADD